MLQKIFKLLPHNIKFKITEDAKATIKFIIFNSLVEVYPSNDSEVLKDAVFKGLNDPSIKWALKELVEVTK